MVRGSVRLASQDTTRPLPNATVVLHRVGRAAAGPVDSVRSDANGMYTFRYRATQDSAVYFVSSTYGGVAYFTSPLTGPDVHGDSAEVVVFDTTSAGPRVDTRSRHLVVFARGTAKRQTIAEVYWLENTSAKTHVSTPSHPAWSFQLPDDAQNVHADGGEIAPDAVKVERGRVAVYAPISPGVRQLQIRYDVPAQRTTKLPAGDSLSVLEVLAEDPGATVSGARLAAQAPVVIQGRSFQRFLAQNVSPNAVFSVGGGGGGTRSLSARSIYIGAGVAALGIVLLLGFTRLTLNPGRVNVTIKETPRRAEEIAHAIAALDARMERRTLSDHERAAYTAQREALTSELTNVLAERDDRL
ncbi:MAG TPA: hypothetical protein VE967_10710 [Gemmatimonadaceae bacterium]|nr:hypothetical protein [Gemmatimonadaceae bacterium]